MNSFKELEKYQVKLFAERRDERVRTNLEGSLDVMRFLGAILEVYMPVMADTFVSLSGGTTNEDKDDDDLDATTITNDVAPKGPKGPSQTGRDIVR